MRSILRESANSAAAVEMDQGGSTAMWIKDQPAEGIVSNPGVHEREIFNGVIIGV